MPLILCKKSKKSNEAFLRKLQKTLFLGIFEHILRCTCGAATFFKNPAPSLFCNYGPLPPYQKSEKTDERFLRKRYYRRTNGRTNGWTNGRTNGHEFIGPSANAGVQQSELECTTARLNINKAMQNNQLPY